MAFIRTALLTLLAATTLALSMPVRRSTPVRRDFTGTASPFDPVSGDDCGCGLDENAQAIKVPLSTVDITPTSPLCECIVAGDASTGGDVVFNGKLVAPGAVNVVGFCETCAPGEFQFSPALLKAIGGDGNSNVTGSFEIGL